ncbi:MAG: ATP-binding protein, partial [Mariprofundaceae bacterium]
NLIGNAIKFTPEDGRVQVRVQVRDTAPEKRTVIAEVADTGCGIAPEDQERIFEPFVQAQGGLKREHGGTGLGLALTRKQVNLLGGSIRLQSRLGEGSRFIIELPAITPGAVEGEAASEAPEAAEQTGAPLPAPATPSTESRGVRPKIVLMDDQADRADAVIRLLEEDGYEVHRADMTEIAAACERCCAYLIMLGIPRDEQQLHDRLQALKAHRECRNLPVILVGGDAASPEFSMGPVGVVEKGLQHQEMLDMIARYCRHVPRHPVAPTVLVIDDDPSVREFLYEALAGEGFQVLLAAGGLSGIQMAVEREPDIIILDLMMPRISGFDVLRQLDRHPTTSHIPVMIYTAKELTREEALRLGREASGVLIKGADGRAELVRRLQKLEMLYPARAHLVDPVLDCFNMRYIRRRLDEEVATVMRHQGQFALVGWHMDDYADYVHAHGERWGIAALKDMLDTVRMATRRGDVCARMGEDRFLLLLPNITPEGAMRVAEKLRIRIRHQRFLLPGDETGQMHASFATAVFDVDAQEADKLLQVLEARLEEAIRAGGDQGCYGGGVT